MGEAVVRCGSCCYFDRQGEGSGVCRASAPRPALGVTRTDPDAVVYGVWPRVLPEVDWCAEHQEFGRAALAAELKQMVAAPMPPRRQARGRP